MAVINLKEVPEDVLKFLLQVQGETKSEKGISQYSLEKTVYKVIRDFKELNDKKKNA